MKKSLLITLSAIITCVGMTSSEPQKPGYGIRPDLIDPAVNPYEDFFQYVNGAPFNVAEFYKAFDIKPGDKLYRAPEQRPVIW